MRLPPSVEVDQEALASDFVSVFAGAEAPV